MLVLVLFFFFFFWQVNYSNARTVFDPKEFKQIEKAVKLRSILWCTVGTEHYYINLPYRALLYKFIMTQWLRLVIHKVPLETHQPQSPNTWWLWSISATKPKHFGWLWSTRNKVYNIPKYTLAEITSLPY